MVLGWLSQIGQIRFGDSPTEGAMSMKNKPPEQEKTETSENFLSSPEVKKVVDEWQKKGWTKRGVVKLLRITWLLTRSKKDALKETKDILSSLKGEDGLGKILGVLKLASEGLRKLS